METNQEPNDDTSSVEVPDTIVKTEDDDIHHINEEEESTTVPLLRPITA